MRCPIGLSDPAEPSVTASFSPKPSYGQAGRAAQRAKVRGGTPWASARVDRRGALADAALTDERAGTKAAGSSAIAVRTPAALTRPPHARITRPPSWWAPWRRSVSNAVVTVVSSWLPAGRQQRRKAPPGAAWAGIVTVELLDEFGVLTDDAIAALDLRLARGNPRRRLLMGSTGRLGVVVAVHDEPPRAGPIAG